MDHLINKLKGLDQIAETQGWTWWHYEALIAIPIIVLVTVEALVYFHIRWKRTGSLGVSSIKGFWRKHGETVKSTLTSVAAQSAGASDVDGASASAPMLEGAGVQLVSPTAVRFYPSLKSDN